MTPAGLKAEREALGMTQTQLAEFLGVTKSSVAKWESGKHAVPKMVWLVLDRFNEPKGTT